MDLRGVRITWLGHGTFKISSPSGKTILLDPWLQDNPACPDRSEASRQAGHHSGDARPLRPHRQCVFEA